eukprot:scaffold97995_cov67-Phaeocystis_antarctica.AAC.2
MARTKEEPGIEAKAKHLSPQAAQAASSLPRAAPSTRMECGYRGRKGGYAIGYTQPANGAVRNTLGATGAEYRNGTLRIAGSEVKERVQGRGRGDRAASPLTCHVSPQASTECGRGVANWGRGID